MPSLTAIPHRRKGDNPAALSGRLQSESVIYFADSAPDAGAPQQMACNSTENRLTVDRSEEHTSELQSLMRISYAVFCLKKKKTPHHTSNKLQLQVFKTDT